MKILLLDSRLGGDDNTKLRLARYEELLHQKGHSVEVVKTLLELVGSGEDLSAYQLAIVHPNTKDAKRLKEEIDIREDFRVILHSLAPKEHTDIYVEESKQVCSYFTIKPEKLVGFIEKWYT